MYFGILTNHPVCPAHNPFAMAIDYVPNHHSRLHTGERHSRVNFAIMTFQTIVTCELKFTAGVAHHHNVISANMQLVSGEGILSLSLSQQINKRLKPQYLGWDVYHAPRGDPEFF